MNLCRIEVPSTAADFTCNYCCSPPQQQQQQQQQEQEQQEQEGGFDHVYLVFI